MDDVITRIIDKGRPPTRADIAELLAAIGEPGKKRAAKDKAVKELYEQSGHRDTSPQGFSVLDELSSFGEY